MSPESHAFDGEYNNHESIEQWDCPYCFKTISSSRPPVFNPDNCSCGEAGAFVNGNDERSQPSAYQQQVVHHDKALFFARPQSYASSSNSISCPEGPEREDPNLNVGNTYLPLAPDVGLNEPQHRRSSSFRSDMSYQMRRFLVDSEFRLQLSVENVRSETKFLPQDIHIQSQQRLKKSKNRSKQSEQSSSGGDASFHSWGGDPTLAVGTQFNEGDGLLFENGYPMTMSEMSG